MTNHIRCGEGSAFDEYYSGWTPPPREHDRKDKSDEKPQQPYAPSLPPGCPPQRGIPGGYVPRAQGLA